MKKMILLFITLVPFMLYADTAEDIATQGDKVWDNLLFFYKRDSRLIEIGTTPDFSQHTRYIEKSVLAPRVDLSDVITGHDNKQYYHFSETDASPLFIFPYKQEIRTLLDTLNILFKDTGDGYEVIGRISNVITADDTASRPGSGGIWNNRDIVLVDTQAFHARNKVCVMVDAEQVVPVGEKLLNELLETHLMLWTANIPENATTLPPNMEPETVAQWFLFFGSIHKNSQIWNQLCSADKNIVSNVGLLRAQGQVWWHTLSIAEHKYFFIGADASQSSDTSKTFLYGIRENDKTIETAKRITVNHEQSGQWRVSLF
jgi:hypothetical protein